MRSREINATGRISLACGILDTQFRLQLSPSQFHSLDVCKHSEDQSAAHFQPLRRLHGHCTATALRLPICHRNVHITLLT